MNHPERCYSEAFRSEAAAAFYDTVHYREGHYPRLLWELEKRVLASEVAALRAHRRQIRYLDFAAGTGRIIGFLEDRVDEALGLDISPEMAARGNAKLTRARILCGDLADPNCAVEGRFDLITAFRFFLNAEPELRRTCLRLLAAKLADRGSLLIFNNHGNLISYRGLLYPLCQVRRALGWRGRVNFLSHGEVVALTHDAGLEIVRRHGIGILSGHLTRLLPKHLALATESALASSPALARLGVDQIYVARRRR